VGTAALAAGSGPDLVVLAVTGPPSVLPGGAFSASLSVCNQGTAASGATSVQLRLSTDTVLNTADYLAGTAPVGALAAGQCASVLVTGTALPASGAYYLGAIVDPGNAVAELVETNNTLAGSLIGVGNKPDFIVSTVTGPWSALAGGAITTAVTVCNQGTANGNTGVQVRLSTDPVINTADYLVGSASTGPLAAGQCTTLSVSGPATTTAGAYYVGAIVDPSNTIAELIETNNTLAGNLMGIGSKPDLVVSAVSAPATTEPGAAFTTAATVCNRGTTPAPAAPVQVRLSTDIIITSADVLVGSASVGVLAPGQCASVSVGCTAPASTGSYYVGALADPSNIVAELIETNNATAGNLVSVTTKPDLVVTSVGGPAAAPPGAAITTAVSVCNQGTAASAATTVEVRLSADAVITSADALSGSAPLGALAAGQCATVSVGGTANAPAGLYTLGAIVDPGNVVLESSEGNNTRAGNTLDVGDKPDLVVSTVSGPAAAPPGAAITTAVSVCNQGTAASAVTTVEVRLSADAVITSADALSGSAPLGALAAGQCATVSVGGTANAPAGLYTLGAIVDPGNGASELNEGNNTGAGNAIDVGDKPDFVVSVVSGPKTAVPGAPILVALTLCNQGTAPSPGPVVEVFLSTDTTITTSDFPIGGGSLPFLDPGQCGQLNVSGSTWVPDGAYYLGAIVDPGNGVIELNESNNTLAGDLIGVGYAPDLIVSAVSGPTGVLPGAPFTATVTVCNQGTIPSYGTDVELLLSTDTSIGAGDVPMGGGPVGHLDAGQCTTVSVSGYASVPDGAYHLGAIVDPGNTVPELLEGNNSHAGDLMGVGYAPDLVVSAVTGPASALPGSPFTAAVTVCNQGTAPSYGSSVDLRLSTDASIGVEDALVGGAPVNYLDPGKCVTVNVNASASVPDGAYHLGAVVDPGNTVPELIESNNAAAGPLLGVGNKPDLIVSAVSGPPSAVPGSAFPVSVSVCNHGTAPSYGAGVDLRLSTDTSIGVEDAFAGNGWVNPLDPGQCASVSVSAYAPGPEGAYYLGAVVDAFNSVDELIESNNSRAGSLIGIGWKPDLVVSAVSGPPSALPGSPFTATVTVCNQGTAPSYGSSVDVRLSTDTSIGPEDLPVGGAPVNYLDPGQCASVSVNASAYAPEGAYYLGAVVDPGNTVPELIESNNGRAGTLLGIGWKPDLVVSAVTGPASALPGSPFTAAVTVCNQGTAPSYGSGVDLRLSTDASIGVEDALVGGAPVSYLDPGKCATVNVSASASVPDGAYHLGAVVDPGNTVPELIESNNATAGGLLGVGHKPDLVVSAVSGPPSAQPYSPFTATVTVCNQGTAPSYGSSVDVRLSTDTSIGVEDAFAGNNWVSPLYPGQCTSVSVNAYAPWIQGAYYLGAVVDASSGVDELIESNNATAGSLIGIGWGPDLVVSAVSAPASALPGSPFTAAVTVCNQGTAPSYGSSVDVRLSTDTSIGPEDLPVGGAPVSYLDPGQCVTVNVSAYAYAPEGAYYVGALVDPGNTVPELIESNNGRAGNLLGIGWKPDLVVSAVTGPASAQPGSPFTAAVTVCNQGTAPSYGSSVEVRLSTDTSIGVEDALVGGAPVNTLDPGQCATVNVNASASVPDGAYHLGAVVDPGNAVPELIESNNATAGALLGVGNKPDLIASAVSGPPSAQPYSPFTATVTVCNQGTAPSSGSSVELRVSSDTSIGVEDAFAGYSWVNPLNPGQCTSVSIAAYMPAPLVEGAYYLGAIVDVYTSVDELIESNNVTLGGPIGVGWKPDLVVSSVSGPASALPGSPFTAAVTVCNQGTAPSSGSSVDVRLSTDASIGVEDLPVGAAPVSYLDPGQCASVTVNVYAYAPEGAYYLGAVVDPGNSVPELIETNNGRAGSPLDISP
jgi:subtilase family serine protease